MNTEKFSPELTKLERRLERRPGVAFSSEHRERVLRAVAVELARPGMRRAIREDLLPFLAGMAAMLLLGWNLAIASNSSSVQLKYFTPIGPSRAAVDAAHDLESEIPSAEVRRTMLVLRAEEDLAPLPRVGADGRVSFGNSDN